MVGIADDHSIVRIEKPLDEEERLCSLIADSITPPLLPNIELITVEGKTLVVIEFFVSSARQHWIKRERPEARVYVRLGSTTRQADPELVAELRRWADGVSFDEMPIPQLSADAPDLPASCSWFGEWVKLGRQTLRTLRLLTQHQGRWVPDKGAVLLLGKERELHFLAWVQCGRFVATDKADIFVHQDIREPLPAAVESVMLLIKKHAMRGADFSATRRKDVWSILSAPIQI